MPINLTQVRTWSKTSDNDGDVFQSEFARLYANVASMRTGLAKSADYTILNTDNAGLIEASNGVAAVTGKTFNTANPVNVASVGHGLVTGDSVVVQNSSAETEVGELHYVVTRVDDDNFTLDNVDNSAGAGGTLDWIKDVKITLPTASAQEDQVYEVMKVDAATTGAIRVTDGSTEYYIEAQYESKKFKSDGTNWIEFDPTIKQPIAMTTGTSIQVLDEYIVTSPVAGINITAALNAATSVTDIIIPQLPENTVAILLHLQISAGGATNVIGVSFDPSGAASEEVAVAENDSSTNLQLRGTYWLRTKLGAGEGRILRAQKFSANTTVGTARIMAYKVKR
jgi:hypothetical protein